MASVKLYLKKPKSETATLIYIVIHINGKRFKISSKESVNPKFWNPKKEEVTRSVKDSMEINHSLKSMKDEMKSIIRNRITLKKKLDFAEIREEFDRAFDRRKKNKIEFFDYYDQFIESQRVMVTPGTIKNYKSTLKRLKEFNEEYTYNLSFDKINHNFHTKFLKFLYNDIGVLTNTAGKHIKTLKTFMNYATKRGINENKLFREFKKLQIEVDKIYLSEEETQALIDLDLSKRPGMKRTRDQFILQCYTGMRFSDLMNFKPENIRQGHIFIRTLKTKEEVKISITKPIEKLLKNFPNYKIEKISIQNLNENLKALGKEAGIDAPTLQVNYRGNTRIERIVPKYMLITTHTARRTFITIADKNGVRVSVIKRVTGIRDDRTLRKYIKITDKDIAIEMDKMWRKKNG
ncbi:phage integrase SAM-like domain-containing protein [Bacteroidota bacterium]